MTGCSLYSSRCLENLIDNEARRAKLSITIQKTPTKGIDAGAVKCMQK